MSFTTENAAEMARKRGRPPKAKPQEAEMNTSDDSQFEPSAPKQMPEERLIPLILKRGWWPFEGAIYFVELHDEDGNLVSSERCVYKEPMSPFGGPDEMARKSHKLLPGTRVQLPIKVAKVLIDSGKADLDTSL